MATTDETQDNLEGVKLTTKSDFWARTHGKTGKPVKLSSGWNGNVPIAHLIVRGFNGELNELASMAVQAARANSEIADVEVRHGSIRLRVKNEGIITREQASEIRANFLRRARVLIAEPERREQIFTAEDASEGNVMFAPV